MPGITGGNSLDFLKGPLVAFDYGTYVAAGAAVTYKYGGWIDTDLEIEFTRDVAKIEPGNSTYPVDAYFTKSGIMIRGTLMEASLRKLQAVLGGTDADVLVASSTGTLPLKEVSSTNWWGVKLSVASQSMQPAYTESAALTFVQRVVTLHRCLFRPNGPIQLDRTGIWKVKFELEAFYDSSVTESTSLGRLGKIVDTTT